MAKVLCSALISSKLDQFRLSRALCVLFFPASFVVPALGAPVAYTINFTATAGLAPTSGSFTYDASTPRFADFHVVWNGIDFDLTQAANLPTVTGFACGLASEPRTGFALISMGDCNQTHQWEGGLLTTTNPLRNFFQFFGRSTAADLNSFGPSILGSAAGPLTQIGSSGTWTISSAVPEPGQISLLILGMLILFTKVFLDGGSIGRPTKSHRKDRSSLPKGENSSDS